MRELVESSARSEGMAGKECRKRGNCWKEVREVLELLERSAESEGTAGKECWKGESCLKGVLEMREWLESKRDCWR